MVKMLTEEGKIYKTCCPFKRTQDWSRFLHSPNSAIDRI